MNHSEIRKRFGKMLANIREGLSGYGDDLDKITDEQMDVLVNNGRYEVTSYNNYNKKNNICYKVILEVKVIGEDESNSLRGDH